MPSWDPQRYRVFADERHRPGLDLLARVGAVQPARVVDLGCGTGDLTAALAQRWPEARVHGIDSSGAMIQTARERASTRVSFEQGDLRDWSPGQLVDVVISNATLQWVDGHRDLIPGLLDKVADGGWLAFQVPGNFDQPSHRLLHELAADPRFSEATAGVERPASHDPQDYLEDILRIGGWEVDAWETTYLHVLAGDDAVFTWISGTGARPILQALTQDQRVEFEAEYKAALREAYPPGDAGTVLPFRRVFVVAHRTGS